MADLAIADSCVLLLNVLTAYADGSYAAGFESVVSISKGSVLASVFLGGFWTADLLAGSWVDVVGDPVTNEFSGVEDDAVESP